MRDRNSLPPSPRILAAFLLYLLAATPLLAGVPRLLGDVNDTPGTLPARPHAFVRLGDRAYFLAEDSQHGVELWTTDGTSAGTRLVAEIVAGPIVPRGTNFSLGTLTVAGNRLYFQGWDPGHGAELWTSDGTAEGTRLLADMAPGPESSNPGQLAVTPTGMCFVARTPETGVEIWRLDAGGLHVIDATAGPGSSAVQGLTAVGERVFFNRGNALWTSDGTTVGPVQGAPPNNDGNFVSAGGKLFFSQYDPTVYEIRRLWVVDGATLAVTDFGRFGDVRFDRNPGFPLYFATGRGLWRTDGVSTTPVFDAQGGYVTDPISVGGAVYSGAYLFSSGYEMWKTDANGTRLIDIVPGGTSSNAYPQLGAGGGVYFGARDYSSPAPRAWLGWTDGDAVQMLADYPQGVGYTGPYAAFALGDTALLAIDDGVTGWEPWVSRVEGGVASTPTQLADIQTQAPGSDPEGFVALGGWRYFSACDAAHGCEMWRTDGTPSGTALVADLYPGATGSYPRSLTAMGGRVYFSAATPDGQELWRTDGTSTTLVKDINPNYGGGQPQYLTAVGDRLYFNAYEPATGRELWTTDGTEAGTAIVADIQAGRGSSDPSGFVALGGRLLFTATDYYTHGREIWTTDGAVATLVKDIAPGYYPSNPTGLVRMGDRVYFQASDWAANSPGRGFELWVTDGTESGTSLVKDLLPGSDSSSPCSLTAGDGVLYFTAWDPQNGRELWTSDGTPGGTRLVGNFFPDELQASRVYGCGGGLYYAELKALGRSALFTGWSPATGFELWRSDGTAAGTGVLKDIWPGGDSYPSELTVAGGRAFFSAYRPDRGRELWTTDGTTRGTLLAADASAGEWSSSPTAISVFGASVLFQADDGATGREPWALEFSLPETSIAGLIDHIEDLIDAGTLKLGQGKSLIGKLELALYMLEQGNTKTAVTMLEAFIHEVLAFKNGGVLTPTEADEMIAIAQAAIASITS